MTTTGVRIALTVLAAWVAGASLLWWKAVIGAEGVAMLFAMAAAVINGVIGSLRYTRFRALWWWIAFHSAVYAVAWGWLAVAPRTVEQRAAWSETLGNLSASAFLTVWSLPAVAHYIRSRAEHKSSGGEYETHRRMV